MNGFIPTDRLPGLTRFLTLIVVTLFAAVIPPLSFAAEESPPSLSPELEKEIFELKLKAVRNPQQGSYYRRRLARLYQEAGDFDRAIFEYRMDVILNPDQAAQTHRRIARVYEERGETEKSAREMDLSRAARPPGPREAHRQRMRQWEEEGRFDLLIQEYKHLLHTSPPSSQAGYLERIASLHQRMGREEDALDYYQQLIEVYRREEAENPDRSSRYKFWIAQAYDRAGLSGRALGELHRLAALGGEEGARAWLEIASLRRKEGDLPAALAACRSAAEEDSPLRSRAYERLGEIHLRLREEEEARRAFSRAADILEENEGVSRDEYRLWRVARLRERAGEEEAARSRYEQLADIYLNRLSEDPSVSAAQHRRLADVSRRLKDYRRAEEHYLALIRLEPDSAPPYLFLSRIYRDHLDDQEAASRYYRRYRALLDPSRPTPPSP